MLLYRELDTFNGKIEAAYLIFKEEELQPEPNKDIFLQWHTL